eukprot:scaffold9027_cov61-Attheya_sp.AAC.3
MKKRDPISSQKQNRCGLVERPIAPWPSVAASAQPHQSRSAATTPSRLLIGTSARASPIAPRRRFAFAFFML